MIKPSLNQISEAADDFVLTRVEIQRIESNMYSQMLLREAKRILEKQRRENPLLAEAARLRQKQR